MKRSPWPRDDSPRRKGTRRVRLWFVVDKDRIISASLTKSGAISVLADSCPDARIRRAVASVAWVDA